jgi:hypothetical protein
MVYRLDQPTAWTRADNGLPESFGATAIDGFSSEEIYAAGYAGALWRFDGKKWKRQELPTNVHLHSVRCAKDGKVYVAGRKGTLIVGRKDKWDIIVNQALKDTLWDLEWFEGKLYVSALSGVYELSNESIELVDFGNEKPKTFYHLSAGKGVMWSIGEKDIVSFDGEKWTRII